MATCTGFYDDAEAIYEMFTLNDLTNTGIPEIDIGTAVIKSLSRNILKRKQELQFLREEYRLKDRKVKNEKKHLKNFSLHEKRFKSLYSKLISRCCFYNHLREAERQKRQVIDELGRNYQRLSGLYDDLKNGLSWIPSSADNKCVLCQNMGGKDYVYTLMMFRLLRRTDDLSRETHRLETVLQHDAQVKLRLQVKGKELAASVKLLYDQIRYLEGDRRFSEAFSTAPEDAGILGESDLLSDDGNEDDDGDKYDDVDDDGGEEDAEEKEGDEENLERGEKGKQEKGVERSGERGDRGKEEIEEKVMEEEERENCGNVQREDDYIDDGDDGDDDVGGYDFCIDVSSGIETDDDNSKNNDDDIPNAFAAADGNNNKKDDDDDDDDDIGERYHRLGGIDYTEIMHILELSVASSNDPSIRQ